MNPKISVIIPVYNSETYLSQCLDSVCMQTLQEIEIICVDDGSTDTSPKILLEYAKKDPRVRILTQQNKGAGAARNYGLRESTGEFLSFLDSDDFFELDMLEEAYKNIEEYQEDFVVFESYQYDMNTKEYVRTFHERR